MQIQKISNINKIYFKSTYIPTKSSEQMHANSAAFDSEVKNILDDKKAVAAIKAGDDIKGDIVKRVDYKGTTIVELSDGTTISKKGDEITSKRFSDNSYIVYSQGKVHTIGYGIYATIRNNEEGNTELIRLKNNEGKRYYPNGNLEFECYQDGSIRKYYESGELEFEGMLDDIKKAYTSPHPKFNICQTGKEYYKSGALKTTIDEEGTQSRYDENSNLESIFKTDGSIVHFYPNGMKKYEKVPAGATTTFYESGAIKTLTTPDRIEYFYNEEGNLIQEWQVGSYHINYRPNGTIKEQFRDNVLSTYDEKGQLESERDSKGLTFVYKNNEVAAVKMEDDTWVMY
ncbi:hypothetical protein IJ531_04235 [bacterium]|nr:hypothetical protein [bacterium]